ncbi:MAG: YerC/YecD family TrpR-related protein [Patescibacteria group bacterium]|nr:YerC/YecD family TrpR-related protein [Patescibacteria group bacterium]
MRSSKNSINPSLKKQITKMFAQLICDIKNFEEAATFLEDFFNPAEIEIFSKRLAIAYWLKKKRSYKNIRDNLKVSSATISTVSELLNKKGLKIALKKVEAEEWANLWAEKIKKIIK